MNNKNEAKVSRRRFLEAAVVTAAAAKSVGAEGVVSETGGSDSERRRLEELVEMYGSEIGDLRKVT